MQSSDFLTLLGLALAVWSIIDKKERDFILLFFSKVEMIIFSLSLLFIHYLMAFEWLQIHWFSCLSIFTYPKGIPAQTWAYILALMSIAYPIFKVSFGYFSSSRLRNLIDLYKSLIKENEVDLLAIYLTKYHINDIQSFLKGYSHLPQKSGLDIIAEKRTRYDVEYEKLISPKRKRFAMVVYVQILQNEQFVRNAANKYPELFATAFLGMETAKSSKRDLVKLYIECLFENKNQQFINELKIAIDSQESIKGNVNLLILRGIFENSESAISNSIWYPVGEGAKKSLIYDEDQREFLSKTYDERLQSELWNYKVYIAIQYFDCMVRESIYRDGGYHMWLMYYQRITEYIINKIPSSNSYESENEYPSFAHFLLYSMFENMANWLDLAKELNTNNRVTDTIACLGKCIYLVCNANESKISTYFKTKQLDKVITMFFKYSFYPDNIGASTSKTCLKQLLLNPNGDNLPKMKNNLNYVSALDNAWQEFDFHYSSELIDEFIDEILKPLGINDGNFIE